MMTIFAPGCLDKIVGQAVAPLLAATINGAVVVYAGTSPVREAYAPRQANKSA
jgi:hypothetical protein